MASHFSLSAVSLITLLFLAKKLFIVHQPVTGHPIRSQRVTQRPSDWLASGSRTRPLKLEKSELVDLDSTRIDLGEVLRGGRPARSGPSSVDNCSGGSGPPPCQAIDTEDLGFVHGVV
ncbi:hypothetical protein ACLB2K_016595 [Fragaria x ananassa]